MIIQNINVTTKKGEVQASRWLITQTHPHPDTEGHSGDIKWRNAGNLLPAYGRPAAGIGREYMCYLLAPGDIPTNYNREQFAGFVPYASYGQPQQPPNPGTITMRGRDLGEMRVEIKIGHGWPNNSATLSVRGHERPTDQEGEMIQREIVPHLRAFIDRHAEQLHKDAVARIAVQFAEQIARVRASAARLEKEANEVIGRLSSAPATVAA